MKVLWKSSQPTL